MEKVSFLTLGCKVNQYETQIIREGFLKKGYIESSIEKSDIILVNTCTVTSKSDVKSLRFIRKAVDKSMPGAKIIVTGCLAELDKDKIRKIQGVNYIFKNKFKYVISDIITNGNLDNSIKQKKIINYFKDHTRAFIKIQDGCNHKCSYCKVTLVRGKSRSRNPKEIFIEVKNLVSKGYKEIVLTGVCLGAYGLDFNCKYNILNLLNNICKIKGDYRIRLSSIEPNYVTKELINYILANDRICKHLHIPLQSGDDGILKSMKRPYNNKSIKEKIDYIKNIDSYFSFSIDIIIGFPGESSNSIENTRKILEYLEPVKTHFFKFSPRPKTYAYNLKDDIDKELKRKWHKELLEISDNVSFEYRKKFIGKIVTVLPEKIKPVVGFNEYYFKIYTNKTLELNKISFLKAKIQQVKKHKTFGKIVV